ncbi:MAG: hypothetical protein WDW38_002596 [Sanguina aurantia]
MINALRSNSAGSQEARANKLALIRQLIPVLPKYLPESAISELLSQFDAGELTPAQSLDSGAWFRFVLHYMSPADHEIANRLTKKRKALQPALEINISQATHSTSPQHKKPREDHHSSDGSDESSIATPPPTSGRAPTCRSRVVARRRPPPPPPNPVLSKESQPGSIIEGMTYQDLPSTEHDLHDYTLGGIEPPVRFELMG